MSIGSDDLVQPPRPTPVRRAPMMVGLGLVGIGTTAALASQTGLSYAQAGSICLLVCAVVLLFFLILRSQSTPTST